MRLAGGHPAGGMVVRAAKRTTGSAGRARHAQRFEASARLQERVTQLHDHAAEEGLGDVADHRAAAGNRHREAAKDDRAQAERKREQAEADAGGRDLPIVTSIAA